jgi:hypothetical protein
VHHHVAAVSHCHFDSFLSLSLARSLARFISRTPSSPTAAAATAAAKEFSLSLSLARSPLAIKSKPLKAAGATTLQYERVCARASAYMRACVLSRHADRDLRVCARACVRNVCACAYVCACVRACVCACVSVRSQLADGEGVLLDGGGLLVGGAGDVVHHRPRQVQVVLKRLDALHHLAAPPLQLGVVGVDLRRIGESGERRECEQSGRGEGDDRSVKGDGEGNSAGWRKLSFWRAIAGRGHRSRRRRREKEACGSMPLWCS